MKNGKSLFFMKISHAKGLVYNGMGSILSEYWASTKCGAVHIALNLIRLNTSIKTSIKTKRLLAATSNEFRVALLGLAVEGESDDEEED